MSLPVSVGDVRAAAERIAEHVVLTPCLHARTLSELQMCIRDRLFTESCLRRGV